MEGGRFPGVTQVSQCILMVTLPLMLMLTLGVFKAKVTLKGSKTIIGCVNDESLSIESLVIAQLG